MTMEELSKMLGVTPQGAYCGFSENAKDKRGCGTTGTTTCNNGCKPPSC